MRMGRWKGVVLLFVTSSVVLKYLQIDRYPSNILMPREGTQGCDRGLDWSFELGNEARELINARPVRLSWSWWVVGIRGHPVRKSQQRATMDSGFSATSGE